MARSSSKLVAVAVAVVAWRQTLVGHSLFSFVSCPTRAYRTYAAKRSTLAARAVGGESDSISDEDWRAFRGRLIQSEKAGEEQGDADDSGRWAYATPLIEQGSTVLSKPGGQFAFRQQYFHKAVILTILHEEDFTLGVIINRPTALTTSQLGFPGPSWPIWFGGDCEGLVTPDSKATQLSWEDLGTFCISTSPVFESVAKEVVKGVYVMSWNRAQSLVQRGIATPSDFILIIGYTGWGRDQLQQELDRPFSCWTMAAIDCRTLIEEIKAVHAEMEVATLVREENADDGLALWQRLYQQLGGEFKDQAKEWRLDDQFADTRLRDWISQNLRDWTKGKLDGA